METLIQRVRHAISLGLSKEEICDQFVNEQVTNEDVFLAYHAAKILDKPIPKWVELSKG